MPMPKVFSVVFQKGPMGLALKRGNSNNNNSDTQGGSPGSNGVIKPSLQRAVSAPVGKVSFPFTSAVASNANKNLPGASCVVSQVQAGLQAERLGLWVGDSLLNVGGEVVPQFDDLMLAIRGAPRPLQMTFVRSPPTVKSPPKALSPPKNGNISTSGENSPIATPPHTLTEANTNADTSRSTSTSEESERSVLSEGINISTGGSKSSGSKSEGGSTATGGLRDDLRMRLNLSSLSIPTDSSTEKDKDRDKDKEKDKERVKDKDKDKEKEKEKRGSDEKKSRVSRRRSYSGEFQTPTKGKEGKEGKVSGCTPVTPVSADKRTPTKGITPNIATSTNSSNSTNAKARSTSWNGSSSSELRDALNSSGNGSGGKSPRVRTPREGGSGKNTPRGIGGKGETPTKNSNSSSNSNGSNNKTTPNSTSSGGSRRRSSSGSGSMGEGGGSSGKKSSTPSTPTPSSSSGPTGSTGGAGAGSSAAKKRLSFDNGGSGGSSGTGRKSPAAPINVFERLSPKAGGKGVGVGKHSPRQSVGAGVGRSSPSNTGRISPSNNSISNGNGNDNGNGHHTQSSSTGRGSPKLSLNAAASPASPTKEGFRAKAAVVPLEYRVVFPAPPLGMTLTKNAHFNTAEVTKLATAGQALTMGVQVGDVVVGLDSDWAGSFDDLMHLLPKKAFPYALVLRRNAMSPRTSMQVSLSLGSGVYISILVVSCFTWSGALDSSCVLLSYPLMPLASPMTNY